MNNVEIMLESYLFPDGKSKLRYATLTEAEKQVFTKNMVTRLFNTIKNKSLKVNYMGLEKTKGDITKYPKYEDIENSIKILNNMYKSNVSDAPKEILSCVRTLEILKKYKTSFTKAFSDKNEPAALLYVNISAALIASVSKIIAATIDYIKQPTGEYKAVFKKDAKTTLEEDTYFVSLERFITMEKTGQLKQLFDISNKVSEEANILDESSDDDFTIGKVIDSIISTKNKTLSIDSFFNFFKNHKIVTAIGVIAIIIWAIYTLPYYFYSLRKSISDHLLNIAYFLEEHAYELDTSNKKGRDIQEKQLRIVEKLKSLGETLSLEDKKANKKAKEDKKKDEEESRKSDDSDNSYDNDDVLL